MTRVDADLPAAPPRELRQSSFLPSLVRAYEAPPDLPGTGARSLSTQDRLLLALVVTVGFVSGLLFYFGLI